MRKFWPVLDRAKWERDLRGMSGPRHGLDVAGLTKSPRSERIQWSGVWLVAAFEPG
jgi:hypothetical protein